MVPRAGGEGDWPHRSQVAAGAASPWPEPGGTLDLRYRCGERSDCDLERFMVRVRACTLYVVKAGVPVLHMTRDSTPACATDNAAQRYGLASITKSVTSLLFGRVATDPAYGPPLDLDTPVAAAVAPLDLPYRGNATLRDLLHMRSRMMWREDTDQELIRIVADEHGNQLSRHRTLLKAARDRLRDADFWFWPTFNYSGFDSLLVGILAERRLQAVPGGPRTLAEAAGAMLWTPLGMVEPAGWKADFEEHPPAYCCLYARPAELARLGWWVLQRYREGADPGAPAMARWVRRSVDDNVDTTGRPFTCRFQGTAQRLRYGYQWWVLSGAGDGFTARGTGGQYLHVFPDLDVVVVQFSDFDEPVGGAKECESFAVHRRIADGLAGG